MTAKIYEFPKKKPKEPDDDSFELFRQEVIDYFVMQEVGEELVEEAFEKFRPMIEQVFYFAVEQQTKHSLDTNFHGTFMQIFDFHTGIVLHTIGLELGLPDAYD